MLIFESYYESMTLAMHAFVVTLVNLALISSFSAQCYLYTRLSRANHICIYEHALSISLLYCRHHHHHVHAL